jgi:hypothetical protein
MANIIFSSIPSVWSLSQDSASELKVLGSKSQESESGIFFFEQNNLGMRFLTYIFVLASLITPSFLRIDLSNCTEMDNSSVIARSSKNMKLRVTAI